MKLLITGSHGMVGKNLLEHLDFNTCILAPSHRTLDLLDYDKIDRYFSCHKPTHVVHLAADVGGLYKNMEKMVDMFENNLQMNTNLLSVCRFHKVKNVIAMLSTCVFPDYTSYPLNPETINDSPPHHSNEGYAYTKRMMERHVEYVRRATGWNWKCFIPVNIFGRHDNFDIEHGHVIPALIHKGYLAAKFKTALNVYGDGKALRQFVNARDVARVIINDLMDINVCDHNTILCGTCEYDIKFIVNIIARYFNVEDINYNESYASGQFRKTCAPTIESNFITDIHETMDWFCKNYLNARRDGSNNE
jgi:GDP-L-fucose synthase